MVIWVVVGYNIEVVFYCRDEKFEPIESKAPVEPCLPPAGRRQLLNLIESLILCCCGSSGLYPLAFGEAQHVEKTPDPYQRFGCVFLFVGTKALLAPLQILSVLLKTVEMQIWLCYYNLIEAFG